MATSAAPNSAPEGQRRPRPGAATVRHGIGGRAAAGAVAGVRRRLGAALGREGVACRPARRPRPPPARRPGATAVASMVTSDRTDHEDHLVERPPPGRTRSAPRGAGRAGATSGPARTRRPGGGRRRRARRRRRSTQQRPVAPRPTTISSAMASAEDRDRHGSTRPWPKRSTSRPCRTAKAAFAEDVRRRDRAGQAVGAGRPSTSSTMPSATIEMGSRATSPAARSAARRGRRRPGGRSRASPRMPRASPRLAA